MNLYIISNVLCHYSRGMCVIAAESMSHCEEIYVEKFEYQEIWSGNKIIDAQQDFRKDSTEFQVIENINHPAGVLNYVLGSEY